MTRPVVAVLETRAGEHLGEMIERRGAAALLAPALEEVPDLEPGMAARLLETWRMQAFRFVIFQTGVGTRALFQAVEELGEAAQFLALLKAATVVVRGPKPVGELNARGVRIDVRAPAPFTSDTLLQALATEDFRGARVLVQRFGAANVGLRSALEARGATVEEVATYRWALPADLGPLRRLLTALARHAVDAVVFTSAVQVRNLAAVAASAPLNEGLPSLLAGTVVASIGPVCSRALREAGIEPAFEANPPKLGPLLDGLDAALAARSSR